jgi:hypothetical protein
MIRKISLEENVNKLLLNFYDVENKTRHAVFINYADSFSVFFFFFSYLGNNMLLVTCYSGNPLKVFN